MPAFAPLLRPVFVRALDDLPVAVAVAAAAFGAPDEEGDLDAEVVGGVDVDVDVDVGVAIDGDVEELVAAGTDADHVVAERSDSTLTRKAPLLEVLTVPIRGPLVSYRFK